MDFNDAIRILAAFEREKLEYVLVGSMAMAAQGLIRATRDIDLFVAPTPENIERLRRALRALFADDANIELITHEDLAGDYPAVEYVPPNGEFSLDILARLGEAFRFESLEWEELLVEGVRVRVATPQMLYRMKKGTVRPQDRVDAQAIRERFGLLEES